MRKLFGYTGGSSDPVRSIDRTTNIVASQPGGLTPDSSGCFLFSANNRLRILETRSSPKDIDEAI